ncbi:DNA-processing protein DprA [Clostridium sp. YIM B02551]|uniref:DNA-processing protein DprA n=1 Tax=Clostridium sp. YIM B02551 TaxID=2910679 RepID=UPI001EE9E394|nr:DNA-processing protein DprA [Clostridium sp. YIM B02551]
MNNENNETFYKLWLATINIPNAQKIYLKNKFKSEKNIYNFYKRFKNDSFNYKFTDKILSTKDEDVYNLIDYINNNSISFFTYDDMDYIKDFEHLKEPPYILFYKGDLNKLSSKRRISIVGSRKPTAYGAQITKLIAIELAKNDIALVSGGAYGVDTIVHKCAISYNSPTCAVLGCGIDLVYPKVNQKLYESILENGVIISEFLPGTPPYAYNFPRRNRIISALGDSLIVTEATEKSGSLITVGYSLELGRDIIAVPGNPLSQNSKGCNQLIKDGAKILPEIDDLYELLKIKKVAKNSNKYTGEKAILLSMIGKTPIHINELAQKCNIDINTIYGLLFELQLEKVVISLNGNYFARIS